MLNSCGKLSTDFVRWKGLTSDLLNKAPQSIRVVAGIKGVPFFTEAAFNEFLLSNTISTTPTIYRKMLQHLVSTTAHKILFTHGDLSPTNIIVKEGRIVGIVDWEYAGWYPEYWEFVQFFRAVYADYRDYADIIFATLYPAELMADHFLGHLTRH